MSTTGGFDIGIFTFGELTRDAHGRPMEAGQRLRDILEWASVADQAGLGVFGVGERHREDFAVPSPPLLLAAAAARTRIIRLTSTVTVLSSADPVWAFKHFATLDLLSGVRAEITAGRGAYLESPRRPGGDGRPLPIADPGPSFLVREAGDVEGEVDHFVLGDRLLQAEFEQ